MLVRVEDVYEVLRSKRPIRPARDVALAMLERALSLNAGTPHILNAKAGIIRTAHDILEPMGNEEAFSSESNLASSPSDVVVEPNVALDLLRARSPLASRTVLRWPSSKRSQGSP